MTIESNYWANVSRKKVERYHFFCACELKTQMKQEAVNTYMELCRRFPASDGWKVTLYKTECFSQEQEV